MNRTARTASSALALWFAFAGAALADGVVGYGGLSGDVAVTGSADTTCSGTPCDLGPCCTDHCRDSFWFAGTDITFLRVDSFTGGRVTMTIDDTNTAGIDLADIGGQGLNDESGYAPRIWLGRQLNENWGVVGRFWSLNDSADRQPSQAPGQVNLTNFLTLSDVSHTELYTVDLEGIRSFDVGRWKFDGSVGARYASFKTDSTLSAFGVFTAGSFMQLSLGTASEFEGPGVTYSLSGRRQLGDSPVYFFVSGRGSNLDGTASGRARAVGSIAVSPNPPLVGAATVTRSNYDCTASIAEFQVGLQLEHKLAYLPVNAFARAAFEYQFWDIHHLPVGGAGIGGTSGNISTNTFASLTGRGEARLAGFTFATGFTW